MIIAIFSISHKKTEFSMLLILSYKQCYFQKEGKTNNAFGKGGHRLSIYCTDSTASTYSSMLSSPSNKNHFFVIWM